MKPSKEKKPVKKQVTVKFKVNIWTIVFGILLVLFFVPPIFSLLGIGEPLDSKVDLSQALNDIKTLEGLIPICANCKKIKDDDGYWHSVEEYMTEHSDVKFTHGLCNDCIKKLYPEFAEEILSELK